MSEDNHQVDSSGIKIQTGAAGIPDIFETIHLNINPVLKLQDDNLSINDFLVKHQQKYELLQKRFDEEVRKMEATIKRIYRYAEKRNQQLKSL